VTEVKAHKTCSLTLKRENHKIQDMQTILTSVVVSMKAYANVFLSFDK